MNKKKPKRKDTRKKNPYTMREIIIKYHLLLWLFASLVVVITMSRPKLSRFGGVHYIVLVDEKNFFPQSFWEAFLVTFWWFFGEKNFFRKYKLKAPSGGFFFRPSCCFLGQHQDASANNRLNFLQIGLKPQKWAMTHLSVAFFFKFTHFPLRFSRFSQTFTLFL